MAVAKLKITKSGQSGILVMGMGKDRTWYMDQTVGWFPANSGTWRMQQNSVSGPTLYFWMEAAPR